MNGPIPSSSLRILPAELDNGSFASQAPSGAGFREVLHNAIGDLQQLEGEAQNQIAGVLEGNGADVHSALIAVEKADLSFQLMMQVRNKIVSAYQEISRMQF
jgi:flagellar hook-basal body complex protein FliE